MEILIHQKLINEDKNFYFFFIFLFFCINIYSHAKEITKIIAKIDNELVTNYDIKNKIITALVLADKEINQKNIDNLKKKIFGRFNPK